jgi:hypothetical protein
MDFWWDNWTPTSEILQLHEFLEPKKISSISTIRYNEAAIAVYGSRASFGVIMIYLKKRKDYKEFLKIQN